jgi:hypothetical protein
VLSDIAVNGLLGDDIAVRLEGQDSSPAALATAGFTELPAWVLRDDLVGS